LTQTHNQQLAPWFSDQCLRQGFCRLPVRDVEPLYYGGPHELWNITGGPQKLINISW